jgi:hypothetical protein
MARYGFLLLLLVLTRPALAEDAVNYCHKPTVDAQWKQLLARTPRDPIVIRLYALRDGLCGMVDAGQLDLETAVKVFDLEHVRGVIERFRND